MLRIYTATAVSKDMDFLVVEGLWEEKAEACIHRDCVCCLEAGL